MTVRDDEPWFVLSDVCRVLDIGNVGNAAGRLDDDERSSIRNPDVTSAGGNPNITIINESGLYSLILTSRKPAAKRFKKWVTAEVLPALRRSGAYVMTAEDEDLPSLADGKVFGMRVAKINAAARMISVANSIYGPAAARALWETEPGLPKLSQKAVSVLAGTADDDPVGCFHHLMRAAAGNGRTIGQVMSLAIHDRLAARGMKEFGIVIDPQEAPGMIAVANQHPFLARHFAETQWIGDWRIALAQLPGAKPSRGGIAFGTVVTKAVLISRGEVLALLNPVSLN
ncbi:MAG: hypothetical protein E5W70_03585 [Mesorhizobium sp.]|nr:MAG: hypothetical protein E5W70_03585 [Mesorhizobium sp.]